MLIVFSFQLACFLPILTTCWLVHRNSNFKFIAGAMTVMFVDVLVVTLTKKIPGLHFEGQNWNWFGKTGEALTGLVIFGFLPKAWRELPNKKSKRWIASTFAVLIVGGTFIGFMNPPESIKAQTFLFQLFMPSLSEEIVYRGVLLALFTRAFAGLRATLLSAILVTAWFCILHGVGSLNGAIQFDLASLLVTAIVGGLLVFLRIASKSLLYPIVGHSIYNLCIQIVPVLRM